MRSIGIFSNLDLHTGTALHCIEIANALVRYAGCRAILLCENRIAQSLVSRLDCNVQIGLETFGERALSHHLLYQLDHLIVVCSNQHDYSDIDFWRAKRGNKFVTDLTKIKQMIFLYDGPIMPSVKLFGLLHLCQNVRVVCVNRASSEVIGSDVRFKAIRQLPRIILDCPIDPWRLNVHKQPYPKVRIGRHALPRKFNSETKLIIDKVNNKFVHRIVWDFMGVPSDKAAELASVNNVVVRKEFSTEVCDYLREIDIFLYNQQFGSKEAWASPIAEAMLAGCPIITVNTPGASELIMHGSNGFICKSLVEIEEALIWLLDDERRIRQFGVNSNIYAKRFWPSVVIGQLLNFMT